LPVVFKLMFYMGFFYFIQKAKIISNYNRTH
jgi:hypothetical protein